MFRKGQKLSSPSLFRGAREASLDRAKQKPLSTKYNVFPNGMKFRENAFLANLRLFNATILQC